MIDIPKLVSYLRQFECRDRDGNYWSPQEILEAADRLEQLQGYVTTDAEEIQAKDDRIEQLEAENAKLRQFVYDTCCDCEDEYGNPRPYQCERCNLLGQLR